MKKSETIVSILVGGIVTGLLKALLCAWILMVTVGVIHGEWLPMMPTIGFTSSLLVGLMLSSLVSVFQFSTSSDD